jgi:flavin reductase (DIM6/NTAB) family NADH-FMN oxidoreductase RutF
MPDRNGPAVDADAFRAVMGSVCTPVSVVTAMAGDRPHGTTVSAFASLSLDPPMVLVSLDRSSDLLHIVRRSLVFGLNVLHSGQSALASAFARKGEDKFNGIGWTLDSGVPRLDGSASWLACRVERLVNGGDHVVMLGHVIAVRHDPAPPLTYYQRGFGTHQPHRAETPHSPGPAPFQPALPTVPLPALPVPQPAFAFDTLEEWFAFT